MRIALLLWRYCNVKQEHNNMVLGKTLRVIKIFLQNSVFQLSKGIKNINRRSCTDNIHIGEKVFAAASFEGL